MAYPYVAEREKRGRRWRRGCVVYLLVAALTFGFAYHRSGCADVDAGAGHKKVDRSACSLMAGAFWPVYWSTKTTLWLFDPETKWPLPSVRWD